MAMVAFSLGRYRRRRIRRGIRAPEIFNFIDILRHAGT